MTTELLLMVKALERLQAQRESATFPGNKIVNSADLAVVLEYVDRQVHPRREDDPVSGWHYHDGYPKESS